MWLFVAISLPTILLGLRAARLHSQDRALAYIEDNGGLVARSNEWFSNGNDEKKAYPVEREYYLFNRDVVAVKIAEDLMTNKICSAIDTLPTLRYLHVTDGRTVSDLAEIEERFPLIKINDGDLTISDLFH